MASKIYVDDNCHVLDIKKASDSDAECNKRTRPLFAKMKISNLFREKDMESHLILVNCNNHLFIFHFK